MIPKIIHFIWFGRGEYNARITISIYNRLLLNIL